jgi:ELWxxDGT repeat protein
MVTDLRPGPDSAGSNHITAVGSTVYFGAYDGNASEGLWKSDGTAAGTTFVKDTATPQSASPQPYNLSNMNGTLYFFTDDDDSNCIAGQFWKSDGTAAGTSILKTVGGTCFDDSNSIIFSPLIALNGAIYFTVTGPHREAQLWRSDGAAAGTQLVKTLSATPIELPSTGLATLNGALFFNAYDSINGYELWSSDGTAAGTHLFKDINPTGDSYPVAITAASGSLFFSAYTATNGRELWHSDSTPAGTQLVSDANPGPASSDPAALTPVNNMLFFSSLDDAHGRELWKSDGTTGGTSLVSDIAPGPDSSGLARLTSANGTLYFTASNESSGYELWKSDGTSAGTALIQDIAPGRANANPGQLVLAGNYLFFSADDGRTGRELWALPTTSNLLSNGGFELDTNNDGRPDGWTSNSHVTRTNATVHSGSYAMRHAANNNASYTISQTVSGLSSGRSYDFGGWVNIPNTSDRFTFTFEVIWRNSRNRAIGTSTLARYRASTNGWSHASAALVAPPGATSAQIRMVVDSLKATIYVDEITLK